MIGERRDQPPPEGAQLRHPVGPGHDTVALGERHAFLGGERFGLPGGNHRHLPGRFDEAEVLGLLFGRGLEEMNRAVALEPDNIGVLIPQAAVLLVATRNMPADAARPLLEQALGNYEKVLAIQAPYFSTLGDHPKGELLFGLAEGYSRLGKPGPARRYFERLIKDAPGSGQAPRARMWLDTGSIPKTEGVGCVGCHK